MDKLVHLDQLYLSHNGIEKIEGLENNVSFQAIFSKQLKFTQRWWYAKEIYGEFITILPKEFKKSNLILNF